MAYKAGHTLNKPKPRLASPLPPGHETTPAPSWWDNTILGPYPGIWTEEQISRIAQLVIKIEEQIA